MKKVGIIGAGNMGSGIVQKTAQEGLSVVMVDMKPEFVQRGFDLIRGTLQEAVERKIMTPEKVEEIMGRIQGTTDYADVKDCDLVIEAVFEDMDIKKGLLKKLDGVCDPKTILATNTSSFSVTAISRSAFSISASFKVASLAALPSMVVRLKCSSIISRRRRLLSITVIS